MTLTTLKSVLAIPISPATFPLHFSQRYGEIVVEFQAISQGRLPGCRASQAPRSWPIMQGFRPAQRVDVRNARAAGDVAHKQRMSPGS
jgi:hypothetical protein